MSLGSGGRRRASLVGIAVAAYVFVVSGAQAAPGAKAAAVRAGVKPVAASTAAPAARLVSVSVEPAAVRLVGATAREQLLVTGKFSDGTERDLTRIARFIPDRPLVSASPTGVLTPRADGKASLVVKVETRAATVPVTVERARQLPPVRFATDVLPVLTKNGCNSGACHGAAAGKNGFKLSLRGYDPASDYEQIARLKMGGRIHKTDPAASLLLKKATAALPHGGGLRFKKGSEEYNIFSRWIAAGAPGVDPAVTVTDLTVAPAERVIPKPGLAQQIRVTARTSDGTMRDVTPWARFSSNDDSVAAVDAATGLVKAQQGGDCAVMVSYNGFVKVARIVVPVQEKAPVGRGGSRTAPTERANFIDDLVTQKLAQLRLEPSPPATGAEFLRRVYLDVIGRLPSAEEAQQFLLDRDREKRAKLIDTLLERPEFVDYRALKLSDLFRVNSQYLSQEGSDTFYRWIRNRVRENVPYDALVRELLTARGSSFHVGPANFFRMNDDPEKLAEAVSQTFLGVRMNCAKCHNHPFEKWKQDDYYSTAAFFARMGRKGGPEFAEDQIYVRGTGEVKHPRTQAAVTPKFLGGPEPQIAPGEDRRVSLAAWLTSRQNREFAKAAVNRLWAELFGRGIVDPVDDFRVSNPPSNDALLDALTTRFIELGYDAKGMLRLILNSRTYQLSSEIRPSNARDTRHFARALPKRMPAEVLADALDAATGKPSRYGLLPTGTRAVQIPDSRIGSYFLDVFGRPKREILCACERDAQPNLSQMLNLVNGSDLNGRIAASDGRIAKALQAKLPDEQIVTQLYLATLSRYPAAKELKLVMDPIRKGGDRKTALEDLLWAILNSQEFIFNH